jgi:hypothetical protein
VSDLERLQRFLRTDARDVGCDEARAVLHVSINLVAAGTAALAEGMIAAGDGSDLGGSLRNRASFCNVVGLRSSPDARCRYPSAEMAPYPEGYGLRTCAALGPPGR